MSAVCKRSFALSLLAAIDPVRIGITALLISRPRPMLNLVALWVGGMAAGIVAALGALLFLRDFSFLLMTGGGFGYQQPRVSPTCSSPPVC